MSNDCSLVDPGQDGAGRHDIVSIYLDVKIYLGCESPSLCLRGSNALGGEILERLWWPIGRRAENLMTGRAGQLVTAIASLMRARISGEIRIARATLSC
jgi:hypothetical protein